MLIDWFTVGAQTLNFLILVWLLKRFLYKPILDAIDAREKRIATELADADAKKAEAKKERDEFQSKNDVFDQQRTALLTKATEEADAERKRLFEEVRQAADELSAKREASLRRDAKKLNEVVSEKTQREVFAIARKVLADLASTTLEEQMFQVFILKLQEMDALTKETIATSIKTATGAILVRSVFDLSSKQRANIQKTINEVFSSELPLQFDTVPELISGIELTANGQKLAWSISEYLASFESSVGHLLKKPDEQKAKPLTAPKANSKGKTKVNLK
jgi:F-type H+-transporting ATPase subunit b